MAYKEDCLSLFGREFWHHPWPNGQGVIPPLSDEFRCAWKQAYGSIIEEDWELSVAPPIAAGNRAEELYLDLLDAEEFLRRDARLL